MPVHWGTFGRRPLMKFTHPRIVAFAVIVSLLLLSGGAAAQAPLEPAQMPSRTSFYLIWRGTPPSEARKTNSLLALWDDADFAPVRSAMFENMMNTSEKDASKQKLTREEIEKYRSSGKCLGARLHQQTGSEDDRERGAAEACRAPMERGVPCLQSHRQGKPAQSSHSSHAAAR